MTEWGYSLKRDVEVPAGRTIVVEIVLPPPTSISVQVEAAKEMHDSRNLRRWVMLDPDGGPSANRALGRDESHRPKCACLLWADVQGMRVPPDVPYRASLRVVQPVAGYATHVMRINPGAPDLQLEPALVKAGDRIYVTLLALREVPIQLRLVGSWPQTARTTLRVVLYGDHWIGTRQWYREMDARTLTTKANSSIRPLAIKQGAIHLRWSGSMIEPGKLEHIEQRLPTDEPIEIPLVLDSTRLPEALVVHANMTPAKWTRLTAWSTDVERPMRSRKMIEDWRMELPGQWREHRYLLAYTHDGRVTQHARIPPKGPMTLRWTRGGYLRIAGAVAYPDSAGHLILRRKDGRPFVYRDETEREAYVLDGKRLGPFPAGAVEFTLHAGRELIGVYCVVVRAGEERRLRIR